ncbi:hypothetical protein C491_00265 [Natronococcus amylolyticus DSM 10524]|uniref:Uncharacterized protein n=1 Tax=Natronococcus amylolyticus DSM 10524 TaxID=1227497 RepID=L9XJU8_9EURY|nr:hypothetical protein [Natronococcus amylolyticus]ELY61711.1 hypothetical protein C491_00265 [Natronococcus amylolyticus DSM 10524]
MGDGDHRTGKTGSIEVEFELEWGDRRGETLVRTFERVTILESGWLRGNEPADGCGVRYYPSEKVLDIRSNEFVELE